MKREILWNSEGLTARDFKHYRSTTTKFVHAYLEPRSAQTCIHCALYNTFHALGGRVPKLDTKDIAHNRQCVWKVPVARLPTPGQRRLTLATIFSKSYKNIYENSIVCGMIYGRSKTHYFIVRLGENRFIVQLMIIDKLKVGMTYKGVRGRTKMWIHENHVPPRNKYS